MKTTPFHTVLTHRRPHPDEAVPLVMFEECGEEKLPGISKARLMPVDSIGLGPDGKPTSGDEMEQYGFLCLGIGGGRFDEHPADGKPRKEGECVTTLIAQELGLNKDPTWQPIIEHVRNNDLNAGSHRFSVAATMKIMYEDYPEEKVVEWATLAFKAWRYEEEKYSYVATMFDEVIEGLGSADDPALEHLTKYVDSISDKSTLSSLNDEGKLVSNFDIATAGLLVRRVFGCATAHIWIQKAVKTWRNHQQRFLDAAEEFNKNAEFTELKLGSDVFLAFIQSDSEQMSQVFRSKYPRKKVAILIQRRSSGNVQIFTDHAQVTEAKASELAKVIRILEQNEKGEIVVDDWNELTKEGRLLGVPEWYYHPGMRALFNGSLTTPGVPPTKMPPKLLRRAVGMVFDPKFFRTERESECLKGICTSTKDDTCPWYALGLGKCRTIRYESRTGAKKPVPLTVRGKVENQKK